MESHDMASQHLSVPMSRPGTLVLAGGIEGVAGAVTAGSVAGASTRTHLGST